MNKEEIISKVADYVKNVCENDTTGHDWYHIQRVYKNAMLINEKENANELILTIIVLMHDLYDHKFFNGKIEEKLEETLKELNIYQEFTEEENRNIIYSCANLGFSSNVVERKNLSKEGQIAQDADRLDALGAMGLARTFIYSGAKGRPMYNPEDNQQVDAKYYKEVGSKTAIGHFYDKCLKLKDLMNTQTAKEIAKHRHEFLQSYIDEFLDEWNGKK